MGRCKAGPTPIKRRMCGRSAFRPRSSAHSARLRAIGFARLVRLRAAARLDMGAEPRRELRFSQLAFGERKKSRVQIEVVCLERRRI